MPLPPSFNGNESIAAMGPTSELLASTKGVYVRDVILGSHNENDWSYDGNSVPGTSAGGAEFPAGALLGCEPTEDGATYMQARSSDVAVAVSDVPASKVFYTWTSAAIANRGSAGNAAIPASVDAHAVVLAIDADITDYTTSNDRLVVPVYYRGVFKPGAIIQDQEAISTGAAWPTAEGACDRLSIMPISGMGYSG